MEEEIQINKLIFPNIMTIVIGKPIKSLEHSDNSLKDLTISEPELIIDLPRSVYMTYLQKILIENNELEMHLLEKYAYGHQFTDKDYSDMLNIILKPVNRSWIQENPQNDILGSFGLCISQEDNGKKKLDLLEGALAVVQVQTWECIIIDILKKSAFDVINCFDFDKNFERKSIVDSNNEKLEFSLNAWRFSSDDAEQNLSNALRTAFMFTLVSYKFGDFKEQYNSFQDYFEMEFYKRVSLVYGIWSARKNDKDISYIPLYESFYNLNGIEKDDLVRIIRAVLDNQEIALDERQMLKNSIIKGAEEFHLNKNDENYALEDNLIKPVLGFILLREKAKEALLASRLLYNEGNYSNCATRCYYTMMYSLKALLEKQGKLAKWKPNELKERETHDSLADELKELVTEGILDDFDKASYDFVRNQRMKCDYSLYVFEKADALTCLNKTEAFFDKIDNITR